MMKNDETRVYLWITNFGQDASVVTKLIGLEPTYIQIPGQPNPQFPKMTNHIHAWQFHSSLSPTAHIDEHFAALLQSLGPYTANIRTAQEIFNVGINAAVYYYQDFTPGIHFSGHAINIIASMNLSVDFDLYFLGKKDTA